MHGRRARGAAETHLVLIPSYNTGPRLLETVAEARRQWQPIWVVIDGSTDGTGEALAELGRHDAELRVLFRERNGGKGAAVLDGLRAAQADGFSHVLVMDADGQHPAASITKFIGISRRHPDAMVLGVPVFDRDAPRLRVVGRRVSNALAWVETRGAIGDSLLGFRVYPLGALLAVMNAARAMRGYDFDAEAAVRLCWRGVRAINLPTPVRYFSAPEGGVSHFRYGRDNLILAAMHARLMAECLARLCSLAEHRIRSSRH